MGVIVGLMPSKGRVKAGTLRGPGCLSGGLVTRPTTTLRLITGRMVCYTGLMSRVVKGLRCEGKGVSGRGTRLMRRGTGVLRGLCTSIGSYFTSLCSKNILARRRTSRDTNVRCVLYSVSQVKRLAERVVRAITGRGGKGRGCSGSTLGRLGGTVRRVRVVCKDYVRTVSKSIGVSVGRLVQRGRSVVRLNRGVHGGRVTEIKGKGYSSGLAVPFGSILRGVSQVKGDYMGLIRMTGRGMAVRTFFTRS